MRVLAVVLALGAVSGCGPEPAPQEVASNDYRSADYCVNGLSTATAQGLASPDRSALMFPWAITRKGDRLTCTIVDGAETTYLVVDIKCDDPDEFECASLVEVGPGTTRRTPTPPAGS